MANLWQFFGLPDPEGPPRDDSKKPKPKQSTSSEAKPLSLTEAIESAKKGKTAVMKKTAPTNWDGPLTSDGEPFHDLGEEVWSNRTERISEFPKQALRYIMPDSNRYSLPLEGMATRLNEGDSLIVDLRSLIHMDAHQSACRRMLREMANDMGLVVFALDSEDKLLLIPGVGVSIDMTKHELGQERSLIL